MENQKSSQWKEEKSQAMDTDRLVEFNELFGAAKRERRPIVLCWTNYYFLPFQ